MPEPVAQQPAAPSLTPKDVAELAKFRAEKEREAMIEKIMSEREAICPRTFSRDVLRQFAEAQLAHDEKHLAEEKATAKPKQ